MANLGRITAKLFVADPETVGPGAGEYIGVFHRWIQEGDLPGLPIDVADYGHVPDGPGVMLIGHEADRALEFGDGLAGFSYQRKRDTEGTARDRLVTVLEQVCAGARRLADDVDVDVAFRTDRLELRVVDRLNAPNTPATFDALRADITAALQAVFPGVEPQLEQRGDDRRPFTVLASVSGTGSDSFALAPPGA